MDDLTTPAPAAPQSKEEYRRMIEARAPGLLRKFGSAAEYRDYITARARKPELAAAHEPDLEKQDEAMESPALLGPTNVGTAAKLAATTTPLVREVAMPVGEALSWAGAPTGLNEQAEFLESQKDAIPVAALESAKRAKMAGAWTPGQKGAAYATGLGRGIEAGSEVAFMALPAAKGVGVLAKARALRAAAAAGDTMAAEALSALLKSGAPEMLLPSGGMAAAGLVPGFNEHVATIPGNVGAAAARGVFGAKKGGAGEAAGRMVGALAPAALPLGLARGAGRSMARGGIEPAAKVAASELSMLPARVAAEGGLKKVLAESPGAGHSMANMLSMLGQSGVAPAATTLAEHAGATPEVAELAGAVGGLALPIAASIPESRMARGAARGVEKERVEGVRRGKQIDRSLRHLNAEEQAAEIARKTESDAETKALEGMYAEEENLAKARQGFLGDIAGQVGKAPSIKDREFRDRGAAGVAQMWGDFFAGKGPYPGAPGATPVETPPIRPPERPAAEEIRSRAGAQKDLARREEEMGATNRPPRVGPGQPPQDLLLEQPGERSLAEDMRLKKEKEAADLAEERRRSTADIHGDLSADAEAKRKAALEAEAAATKAAAPEVEKALKAGPPQGENLDSAAGDAIEAPKDALVRVGTGFGKVVRPSEDGRTLVVQMPGEAPKAILATDVGEVVWRPEETPTTVGRPVRKEPTAEDESKILARRKPPAEGQPPESKVPAPPAQESRPETPPPPAPPVPVVEKKPPSIVDAFEKAHELPKGEKVEYEEIPEAKPVAEPGKKPPKATGDPAADWWNALPPAEKVDVGMLNGLRKSERLAKGFRNLTADEKQIIVGAYDRKMAKEVPFAPKAEEVPQGSAGEQGRGAPAAGAKSPPSPETPASATPEERNAKRAKYGLPPEGKVTLYRGVSGPEYAEWEKTGIIKKGLSARATTDPVRAEAYAKERGGEGGRVIKFEADADSGIQEGGNEPGAYRILKDIKTHEPVEKTPSEPPPLVEGPVATAEKPEVWPIHAKMTDKALEKEIRDILKQTRPDESDNARLKSATAERDRRKETPEPPPLVEGPVATAEKPSGKPDVMHPTRWYNELSPEERTKITGARGDLDFESITEEQRTAASDEYSRRMADKARKNLSKKPTEPPAPAQQGRELTPPPEGTTAAPTKPEKKPVTPQIPPATDDLRRTIQESTEASPEEKVDRLLKKLADIEIKIENESDPAAKKALAHQTTKIEEDLDNLTDGRWERREADYPKPKAPYEEPKVVVGGKTVIEYGQNRQDAEWGAMRLRDLVPSHLPEKVPGVDTWTAKKNPEYPEGTQPREYDPNLPEGKENLAKAEDVAKNLSGRRIVSDIPIAAEGTIIVFRWKDPKTKKTRYAVAGGTGRTLGMLMHAADKGNLDVIRDPLRADAERFGMKAEDLAALGEDAVPARFVDMDPTSPEGKEFARLINIPETQAEGPLATAAALNHVIDKDMFRLLGGDFDAAMSGAVSGYAGKPFREALRKNLEKKVGRQIREFFDDDGQLTAKGKDIVRLMMVTKVFPKEVVQDMTPELQQAVGNSAVQFARLRDEFPDIDPARQFAEAVRYYNENLKPSGITFDEFFKQMDWTRPTPPISAGAKMMLEFIDKHAGHPKVFKQRVSALLETLRQSRQGQGSLLGKRTDAEEIAEALGVRLEPDAKFGGRINPTTFGANMLWQNKSQMMQVLRGIAGGAAGNLYAAMSDTSDDPEKRARRRLAWTIAGVGLGMAPGWSFAMNKMGGFAGKVIPEDIQRRFRGGVRSSDYWRDMETMEEKSKWLAHEVATALPEFTQNPRLEQAVVEVMAGEKGFDPQATKKAVEAAVGSKKAAEFMKAVDAYRAHNDRLTNDLVYYKRLSPETAEEYRNGWTKRLMLDVIEAKGRPWGPKGTTPRPKIDPHEFRTSDSHGVLLAGLSDKQVDEAFRLSGAQDPWMTPYGTRLRYGNDILLKWEPTPEGQYQKGLFIEGLKDALKADGTAPKGGIAKYLDMDFEPMTAAEREAHGEISNPKAVGYVSLAQRGKEVAEGKFYHDVFFGKDQHGKLAMEVPLDPETGKALYKEGAVWTDEATGQEFTVVPQDRTWGWLSGKALRKEWFDELTDYHASKSSSDAFWDALKSNFKGVKIATPGGMARNFLGNPIMAMWAKGIPRTPGEFRAWSKTMADFARAAATGDRRILAKYIDEAQIQLHDADLNRTGSDIADQYLDRLAMAGRDAEVYEARKKGELAGEILSFGQLSKGHGKVPGWAVASAGGALTGAASGLLQGEDWKETGKRALYGAVAGGALNRPLRGILRNYNLVDAAWKAATMQVHKQRGIPLAESRRLVRDRMQDFEHSTPIERGLSGSSAGKMGAVATMTLNPFIKWYTQLLRTFKNTAAESPARAMLGLMAVPAIEALAVGGLGAFGYNKVFGSNEERRAAEERYPGGVFVKGPGPDGKPQAVDLTNIAILEGLRQDLPGLMRPYLEDSALGLLGDVVGSPAMILPDAIDIATEENPKDMRGYSMRKAGQPKAGAIAERFMQAFSSPLQPGVGQTAKNLEESVTEKYKPGRLKRPTEPVREFSRALTGVPVRELDVEKDRQGLIGRYRSEEMAIREEFQKAKKQARYRTDPEKMRELIAQTQERLKAARASYRAEKDRILPRMAGAGR